MKVLEIRYNQKEKTIIGLLNGTREVLMNLGGFPPYVREEIEEICYKCLEITQKIYREGGRENV